MYCPESLAAVRLMDVAAVGGGCMVRPSDRGVLGKAWKRRMVEEGASTVFIDITSGSGPECAPSPIRGPLNSYSKK